MSDDCIFCNSNSLDQALIENDLAYVRYDKFPVAEGHLLVISKRHEEDYFNLSAEEQASLSKLIVQARDLLVKQVSPDGINIGVNIGVAAGQTIMHTHMHIIPRYEKDVTDPRGGIRCVIPDKQKY